MENDPHEPIPQHPDRQCLRDVADPRIRRRVWGGAGLILAATTIAACGGSSSSSSSSTSAPAATDSAVSTQTPASVSDVVLPVTSDPISNPATAQDLVIDQVLVENNVDPSGKDADDHLEDHRDDTGASELGGFEVFYTISDPTTGESRLLHEAPRLLHRRARCESVDPLRQQRSNRPLPRQPVQPVSSSMNGLDVTVEVSDRRCSADRECPEGSRRRRGGRLIGGPVSPGSFGVLGGRGGGGEEESELGVFWFGQDEAAAVGFDEVAGERQPDTGLAPVVPVEDRRRFLEARIPGPSSSIWMTSPPAAGRATSRV
ncbi:MAG: hypothetical protein R2705_15305 [Ilumatobacteraceae bacterium]